MSSPTSFSFLNRISTFRPSLLSDCSNSQSDASPSHRDDAVLRVICFAPSPGGNFVPCQSISGPKPLRGENEHQASVPLSWSTGVPSSTATPHGDDWWRKPPQHRGRGLDISELRQSELNRLEPRTGQSVSGWVMDSDELKEHTFHDTPTSIGTTGGVPVFVMLPLDSITINNTLNRRRALNASLAALKSGGVEGIMMDVWWGIVEKDAPGQYNWAAYRELIEISRKHGLKVQAVMSFHQCGGNVGDSCSVPLPKWVVEEINKNPDIVYTDRSGKRNYEYLSLGCDTLPVLNGRSPVQVYTDFMRNFRDEFQDLLGETIVEIQVGMGPAGELRYPSYPESNGRWKFPGIGEFQCYDKYMLASLKVCAEEVGRSEWGAGGPHNAGHYKQWPDETEFFKKEGTWNTPYGEFFLSWYSEMLTAHGERILSAASGIFRGTGAHLSGKVAGIHWHYCTRSHAPELTAGYYNTHHRDGYYPIASMFARHGVTLNFTCIEMKDSEQPESAMCSPEGLLKQVVRASRRAGIRLAGENALPRFDQTAHDQVVNKSRLHLEEQGVMGDSDEPMCSFTYLRMCETLFHAENWRVFVPFVRHMGEGRTFQPWEVEHQDTQSCVHSTRPLVQEAAIMYH